MNKTAKCFCTLLLTGSLFLLCGCARTVAEGVSVNGVEVGGMSFAAAEAAVRRKIGETLPPLIVHSPAGDFIAEYPELSFTDDVPSLLRRAKKGQSLTAKAERTFADAEEFAERVCRANAKEGTDAQMHFSADGFEYIPETDGISCDYHKLLRDITSALGNGETEIGLSCTARPPAVTEQTLREQTQKIARFSTRFDASNAPRTHNICLAVTRISGTVLHPGESFSFNEIVGKRTEMNGFLEAVVIQDGQFVEGVGGGVCQVSTTLFNAALLSGMKIRESRAHSLRISYVAPSLDAMVSEESDLKFVNPYPFPVYLLGEAEGGEVRFEIFGTDSGTSFATESKTLYKLPPPPVKYVEGTEEKVIRAEQEGLVSESYLLSYDKEGNLLYRERIRRDSYAAIQGIIQILPE